MAVKKESTIKKTRRDIPDYLLERKMEDIYDGYGESYLNDDSYDDNQSYGTLHFE